MRINRFFKTTQFYEKSTKNLLVGIFSREEIENCLQGDFPESAAVISFYDPQHNHEWYDYAPVDYSGRTDKYIHIELEDIDIDELGEHNMTYDTYFPDADKLADFIIDAHITGHRFVCQCEYGQSRSAGCAAAICQFFCKDGITVFADYRYYPSRLVYHKVIEALNKKMNNER